MKHLKPFLLILYSIFFIFETYAKDINILDAGAKSDGITLCTSVLQHAIDKVSETGGGTVIVPPGTFLTGALVMKNDVTLLISKGATLLGSENLADYLSIQPEYVALRTTQPTKQLIFAEGQVNIAITGQGTIDGQGAVFKRAAEGDDPGMTRPHLIQFINCKNVKIEGITMLNSGGWMQHYLACDNLLINGITVYNHCNYNNDGIDIDGCHDVVVTNCFVDSDDDGICLKSTSPRSCKNVVISNCVVKSHCNSLKLGTETTGGFENIIITNCTVSPSIDSDPFFGTLNGQSAISVEMVDGGVLDGVSISNIIVKETNCPIFIRLGNRARKHSTTAPDPGMGSLRNVMISNVTATTSSKIASNITGIPGGYAEDISLNNIMITLLTDGTEEDAKVKVPEKDNAYPTAHMFGRVLPASGFFVRHIRNIVFENVQIFIKGNEVRPAFLFHDVHNAVVKYSILTTDKTNVELLVKDVECSGIRLIN